MLLLLLLRLLLLLLSEGHTLRLVRGPVLCLAFLFVECSHGGAAADVASRVCVCVRVGWVLLTVLQ